MNLAEGKNVIEIEIGSKDGTNREIYQVTVTREEAKDTTDKENLNKMISSIEKLNQDDFTEASWNELMEKLEAARAVAINTEASQEEVDHAYFDLAEAFNELEHALNTSAAEAVMAEAEAVLQEADKYRPSDIQAVSQALQAVKDAVVAEGTTQAELNGKVDLLLDALIQLRDQVDASRLQKLAELAESLLEDKEKYTADSIANLEAALKAAQDVLVNENRTQTEVGDAYTALSEAIAELQIRGSKEVLLPLIERAKEILAVSGNYTASSLEGLEEALNAAQTVYDDPNALQEAVNEAAAKLAEELAQVRILGDVNKDGAVDTSDAAEVLKANAELGELEADAAEAADVNRDGAVDTGDAVVIQKYAAEMIAEY